MESRPDPRNTVLNMLDETLKGKRLSHMVMAEFLSDKAFSDRDRDFARALYIGVLESLPVIDFNISAYSNTPMGKIRPVVKNILRISIYQMFFMSQVPDRAALSEALRLLEKRGLGTLKGYANGVLRAVQSGGLKEDIPEHVRACVPEWLYKKTCADIGKEQADSFFAACLAHDERLYAFLNTAKFPRSSIIEELRADGISVLEDSGSGLLEIGLEGKSLEESEAFRRGMVYIQSPNSARCARAAAAYCEMKSPFIMDVCAAPGGKSINLAAAFPKGKVLSSDKSVRKVSILKDNISRMDIENITPRVWNAREFDERYKEKADAVIVDAPCSGLGTSGGKPDIKYRLKPEDIPALAKLQREILSVSSGYVKAGGILIYSTCTLTKEENRQNALWFENETDFRMIEDEQYITYKERADGFYVAVFRKN